MCSPPDDELSDRIDALLARQTGHLHNLKRPLHVRHTAPEAVLTDALVPLRRDPAARERGRFNDDVAIAPADADLVNANAGVPARAAR